MAQNVIRLHGCRPEPIAHYLKALGIFRLVSQQKDSKARAFWEDNVFCIRTSLDKRELETFFLEEYVPSGIVAPWNGGSGFYPKDKKDGIDSLSKSSATRFGRYREVIESSRQAISALGLKAKPEKEQKEDMLRWCRNNFHDHALAWLDAAYLLTDDNPIYPPLLGTGGNDGRLEFSNNFMLRLTEIFDMDSGMAKEEGYVWLRGALFEQHAHGLVKRAIGQFYPGAAGGANATTGFDGDAVVNPWDFVFTLEGAILFAAASSRRLDGYRQGGLSYPFTVRQIGAGYGSASTSDESNSRAEMWLPVWSNPTALSELEMLFSEGRAHVGRKRAVNGVDFARAIASLGVDRGINSFYRYGFQVRNGLAYFATPLGRWDVQYRQEVDLINESGLSSWLDSFRRAGGTDRAPNSIRRALNKVEDCIMYVCQYGGASRMTDLLIALGEAEATLALNPRFVESNFLKPIPLLPKGWLEAIDDDSVEYRLASSIASISFRENMSPVSVDRSVSWLKQESHPRVVWGEGSLLDNLYRVFSRRILDWQKDDQKGIPIAGSIGASLDDVNLFLSDQVDEQRLSDIIRGLSLLRWETVKKSSYSSGNYEYINAGYALIKLVHLFQPIDNASIPYDASISKRAWSGNFSEASRLASRRLRASGFVPMIDHIHESASLSKRIAASLLIPLADPEVSKLKKVVLQSKKMVQ